MRLPERESAASSSDDGPADMQSAAVVLPADNSVLSSLLDELLDPTAFLQFLDEDFGRAQDITAEHDSVPLAAEGTAADDGRSPSNAAKLPNGKKSKTRNYDPNKARSERLHELRRLRMEATDLELKLQRLQTGGNRSLQHKISHRSVDGLPAVWEDICARQFERRMRAEQENCRLKKEYRAEVKVARDLEKLLSKRLVLQNLTSEMEGKCVRRIEIPAGFINYLADRIFEQLATGVEVSYYEVERVLEIYCAIPFDVETPEALVREGTSMELFDRRILPFNMHATGEAWWRRWQNYRGQRLCEDEGDVFRERCGWEMVDAKTDKCATFYVQQVLRRHMEAHRIVIVWHAYFEPFIFDEKRIRGVHFLLKGYVLIKPVETNSAIDGIEAGEAATQVLTYYNITPHFLDPKMRKAAKTNALFKFVVSATSANISTSNEAMENLLFDEALQSVTRT